MTNMARMLTDIEGGMGCNFASEHRIERANTARGKWKRVHSVEHEFVLIVVMML